MQRVEARPPGLGRFPFYIHDDNDVFISEKIRRRGVWEQFETRLLLSLLRPGDQVLDIGANIGWYTIGAARRVGAAGHVFAFEPDAHNHAILTANIRESGLSNATAIRAALGRTAGRAEIRRADDNQGDVRLRNFSQQSVTVGQNDVSVVSLDEYLHGQPHFALEKLRILKMDVQGFEWDVLCGAQRLLRALPDRTACFMEFDPLLLRECSDDACNGFIDVVARLQRNVFAIGRPLWRLRRMFADDLVAAATFEQAKCFDLVIAHDAALADLREGLPFIPRLLSSSMRH